MRKSFTFSAFFQDHRRRNRPRLNQPQSRSGQAVADLYSVAATLSMPTPWDSCRSIVTSLPICTALRSPSEGGGGAVSETFFLRGNCNDDGNVDMADAVCILNWLFACGAAPGCVAATNTNGDDGADITDATYLLNHLFSGGPVPVAPFPDCGPGTLPADEALGCANTPDCQ